MQIKLAYGKTGHTIHLDDSWNVQVVEPRYVPGLPEPFEALRAALRAPTGSPPLAKIVPFGKKVGIIVNDLTRPTPNPLMLSALFAELAHIPKDDITLFVALGTHRPNTPAELLAMLGEQALTYRIVQNNAFDLATQVCLGPTQAGTISGSTPNWPPARSRSSPASSSRTSSPASPAAARPSCPAWPACAPSCRTTATSTSPARAPPGASPTATPSGRKCARWRVPPGPASCSTWPSTAKKPSPPSLPATWTRPTPPVRPLCARQPCSRWPQPFDIVVTTNSGYPLDLNLYQTVKGMSAAAQVVKPGGAIIAVSECWDGIPSHGLFGKLLSQAGSPAKVLETVSQPGFLELDQWEAQVQAQVQLKAEVHVFAGGLTDEQIRAALLIPCRSVEDTLRQLLQRYGPQARICVLPEGPQTVPYVEEK